MQWKNISGSEENGQKWIEENHDLIVSKWNEFSNGFEIGIA